VVNVLVLLISFSLYLSFPVPIPSYNPQYLLFATERRKRRRRMRSYRKQSSLDRHPKGISAE